MTHQLTQKERSLLQDQKTHEEICIKKYKGYANLTQSQELRNLFNELAKEEQDHYDTLNRYLGTQGSMPQPSSKHQGGMMQAHGFETADFHDPSHEWSTQDIQAHSTQRASADDAAICQDMLMTEKYISGAYDTTVFESVNPELRKDLQKIQKDEQDHGKKIFDYMHKHGYYNPK